MKKLVLFAAVLVGVAMASCGGKNTEETTSVEIIADTVSVSVDSIALDSVSVEDVIIADSTIVVE